MNRTASRMAIVSAAAMAFAGNLPPMRGFGPKHAKRADREQRRRAKEREQIARIEADREARGYYAQVNGTK